MTHRGVTVGGHPDFFPPLYEAFRSSGAGELKHVVLAWPASPQQRLLRGRFWWMCFQSQSSRSLKIQYSSGNVVDFNFKSLRHGQSFSDGVSSVPVCSAPQSAGLLCAASRLRCDIIPNRVRRPCGNPAAAACCSEILTENNTPPLRAAAAAPFVLRLPRRC